MTLVQKGNPEQAHRPTKSGPLFTTHQNRKTRDKHNYRQATEENKENNTIKSKILRNLLRYFFFSPPPPIVVTGSHPYPGMDVNNVIRAVQDGLRLPKPSHCSDKL